MVKNPPANAGDSDLIPGLGWEEHLEEDTDNPLQYSCLENLMDQGAWGLQSIGLHRVGHD